MTTDPIALLRDAEAYLSALHTHVARHDNLGANLSCGGCLLRDRIAAALPELAAVSSAVAAPPTDQTALRQEIRRALAAVDGFNVRWLDEQDYVPQVEAVLAVLPPSTDRAAVLREAADAIEDEQAREETEERAQHGFLDHETELQGAAVRAKAELLRRLADETPHTTPQPTATEEAPEDTARRFARRLFAVERLCSGRPGYHTLTVKQVLTAISEADDEPAAGVRQDGEQQ